MKVGILSHEFLINTGANDLLKNFLVALNSKDEVEIFFVVPNLKGRIEQSAKRRLKSPLFRKRWVKKIALFLLRPSSFTKMPYMLMPGEYAFYQQAAPRMQIVESDADVQSLKKIQNTYNIEVFFPSIRVLAESMAYVTYWPDCQPKHFPEFFDHESQNIRDEMISKLLATGKPMIINSTHAKNDMHKFYSPSKNQITALPFSPFLDGPHLNPSKEMIHKYHLPENYFIVCNQFWVHKSIETVFEAIRSTPLVDRIPVVFTGRMEEPRIEGYVDKLLALVNEYQIGEHVSLLGYIPKEDQLALIQNSVSVIQPTLFEGGPGGGATYDAISLGVRVLLSDIPVNREIDEKRFNVKFFPPKDFHTLALLMQENFYERAPVFTYEDLFKSSRDAIVELGNVLYHVLKDEANKN